MPPRGHGRGGRGRGAAAPRGGARGRAGARAGVDPQNAARRADHDTYIEEQRLVREQQGTNLKWSTVNTYVACIKEFETYLEGRPGGESKLLSPRVQPMGEEHWPSVAERKINPMLHFKKHPINIDWTTFELVTFKAWRASRPLSLYTRAPP